MESRILIPVVLVIIVVAAGWLIFSGLPARKSQTAVLAGMVTSDMQS